MTKKIIPFEINLKSSQRAGFTFQPRPQILTNDANSAELNFIITDASSAELTGATATVLLFMKDGSFFQNTDVTRVNNTFVYTIKPNQAKHSGVAQAQLVVKIGAVENASPLMELEIVGGLETKPIVERDIQDWTSLTAEAKAFVDQIEDFTLESFVENKMGEELANLEVNYAGRLTGLESNDASLTAQLAQTEYEANRKRRLEDLEPEVLLAIQGGEGTSFNLLSEPQNKSVTFAKMSDDLIVKDRTINLLDWDNIIWGGYYNTTGTYVNDSNYGHMMIPVETGEIYTFWANGHGATFWGVDNSFVAQIGVPNDSAYTQKIVNTSIRFMSYRISKTSPKTMCVSGSAYPDTYIPYYDVGFKIKKNQIVIDNLSDNMIAMERTENILNPDSIIWGTYYNTVGSLVNDLNYGHVIIPVVPGKKYTNFSMGGNYAFFNESMGFVAQLGAPNDTVNTVAVSNSTIRFYSFRISKTKTDVMCVEGEIYPDVYVPFYAKKVIGKDVELQKEVDVLSTEVGILSEKVENGVPETLGYNFIRPWKRVTNPVLTKDIVTDRVGAGGVADPFLVKEKGRYHMFFEVLQGKNPTTQEVADEIGHAYSDDLINWHYTQIVLSKAIVGHRSAYPHVFKVDGEWYMTPDLSGMIKLYRATNFPLEWVLDTDLITVAYQFLDTNIFKFEETWYLTTTQSNSGVTLYYNDSGDWKNNQWTLHPNSLIIPNTATEKGFRGAGNPVIKDDHILLPIQVTPTNTNVYGEYTYLYKISNLTTTTSRVTNLGKLTDATRDGGWGDKAMHHVSQVDYVNRNIYAVDGFSPTNQYSIGLYTDV